MELDISCKNLIRLKICDDILRCYDVDGSVSTYLLKGITKLDCSANQLRNLPKLPKILEELYCSDNQLQHLPKLPKTLNTLYCSNNPALSELPTLPKALLRLYFTDGQLQVLPNLPRVLKVLCCSNNHLQVLPKLPEALNTFYCSGNPLIFIPPLAKRPQYYDVPKNLKLLHSPKNYSKYRRKYQTYFYLITYLAFLSISPSIILNEYWWFPGILD